MENNSIIANLPEEMQGIVFVDLRIDYAFKLIFGTRGNEDLLLELVRAVLPEKNISRVTLSNQENVGLRPGARRSIYDIACTTESGEFLSIEMQYRYQDDFDDRMLFYSTFPVMNSLLRGQNDSYKLSPIYLIGITNFINTNVPDNPRLINHYSVRSDDYNDVLFSKKVHYVTVELPKFSKSLEEVTTIAEMLFYTFNNMGGLKAMPDKFKGTILEKLYNLCRFAAMGINLQMDYIREFMADLDARSQLRSARELAMSEGLAEGRAEGRAENARETAKKLRDLGVEISVIAEATGLSVTEIQQL